MDYPYGVSNYETLLRAAWTAATGVVVDSSDLPPQWHRALDRMGRDLTIRHFNGTIAHIEFEAKHRPGEDDADDYVWLSSNVTPVGDTPHGMGHDGGGAVVHADEESVTVSCAYLVQDQIARTGIVWPRGRAGGFLDAGLVNGIATWSGRDGEQVAIGSLRA